MYTSLTSKGINRNTSRARLPLVSLLEVRAFHFSFVLSGRLGYRQSACNRFEKITRITKVGRSWPMIFARSVFCTKGGSLALAGLSYACLSFSAGACTSVFITFRPYQTLRARSRCQARGRGCRRRTASCQRCRLLRSRPRRRATTRPRLT